MELGKIKKEKKRKKKRETLRFWGWRRYQLKLVHLEWFWKHENKNKNKTKQKNKRNWKSEAEYRDHTAHRILKINKNFQKSPGDLRKLAVTQTHLKDLQLAPVWKTKKMKNQENLQKENGKNTNYMSTLNVKLRTLPMRWLAYGRKEKHIDRNIIF